MKERMPDIANRIIRAGDYANSDRKIQYLSDFFEQNKEPLFIYAARLTQDTENAKDLLQDTICKILRNHLQIRIENYHQIRGMFYTSIHNNYVNLYRQEKKHGAQVPLDEELSDTLSGNRKTDIETILSKRQLAEQVRSVLHEMAQNGHGRQAEVFLLNVVEHRSYDEIAEMLNWPSGTVKSTLYRARNYLQERLAARNITVNTLREEGVYDE
jgi:RNA polymerase sigma factor (sigma-70 family)